VGQFFILAMLLSMTLFIRLPAARGSNGVVITTINVGSSPTGVEYDPHDHLIYVANDKSGSVSLIDDSTSKVIKNITGFSEPAILDYDSIYNNIYVTNLLLPSLSSKTLFSRTVAVISASTNKIIANITGFRFPAFLAFDSAKGKIYVTDILSDKITVIDGSALKWSSNVTTSTLDNFGVTYDHSNHYIYVTNFATNSLEIINDSTKQNNCHRIRFFSPRSRFSRF
jgi:YVTN family beta-propeller protein